MGVPRPTWHIRLLSSLESIVSSLGSPATRKTPCHETAAWQYTRRGASEAQLVEGVESGDLVALREGRIVEDRLEKVVHPAAEPEHGLADVDQLGRAGPDGVDAEEPPIVPVKEHLEKPAVVSQDLP